MLYVVGAAARRGLGSGEATDCWFAGAYSSLRAARAAQHAVLRVHAFVNTQVWALGEGEHVLASQPEETSGRGAWPAGCVGTKLRWHSSEDWDDAESLELSSDESVDDSEDDAATRDSWVPALCREVVADILNPGASDPLLGPEPAREPPEPAEAARAEVVVVGRRAADARSRHWEWVPLGVFASSDEAAGAPADGCAFRLTPDAAPLVRRDAWRAVEAGVEDLRRARAAAEAGRGARTERRAREDRERAETVARAVRAYRDWVGDEEREWWTAGTARAALLDAVIALVEDARAWPAVQGDEFWREKEAGFVRRVRGNVNAVAASDAAPPEPFLSSMKRHFYKLRPANRAVG